MSVSDRARPVLRGLATWGLSALLLVACGSALSQQTSREQEQMRRLRLQVQQLQQDQTQQQDALQRATADKAGASAELDALRAELRRVRAAGIGQTRDTQAARKELDAARQEQAALKVLLDQAQVELQTRGRSNDAARAANDELQRGLVLGATAHTDLTSRHAAQTLGLQTCIANNQALRDIGLDLMQLYAHKSVADVWAQNEPFLQVQRVALENLLQGYQDKLDDKALKAAAGSATAAAGPSGVREPARAP